MLSYSECVRILIDAGASYGQAKNGVYVYFYHKNHLKARPKMTQEKYDQILDNFNACNMEPKECIRHLEEMGFSMAKRKQLFISIVTAETSLGKGFNHNNMTKVLKMVIKSPLISCLALN